MDAPRVSAMDRREFVELTAVVVVGAGAAGMSAAHLSVQRGVDVQVLEARPVHGGRIEDRTGWVDCIYVRHLVGNPVCLVTPG